jgi:AraC-like DNA-binding protein
MASTAATPTRTGASTREPDEAHAWLRSVYPDYQPEESNSRRDFQFQGTHTQLGRSGVARLRYSMSADNNVTPEDVVLIVEPSEGVLRVSRGRAEETAAAPGEPVLFPPHEAVSALWADADAGCVSLQAADVERVAVETTGIERMAFRFTGVRPMSPGLARRWNDLVRRVVGAVLRDPEVTDTPLLEGELTQLLAAAALDTFPSTRLASHPRVPPGYDQPAVVRRAVLFIEDNAERETTLSEIAAAAGTGPRALQAAFLRHQETTPTAYARRVRLERAHRALQAADPDGWETVPAIAARWGFGDVDRFVDAYSDAYSRSPFETLRS